MHWFERVALIVKQEGLRQAELAERLGVKQGAVSNVLSGKRPNAGTETVLAYADALGLNPSWVLSGEGPPYKAQLALANTEAFRNAEVKPPRQETDPRKGWPEGIKADLLEQFVDLAARMKESERPFSQVGEMRFRQYVQDREPEHAPRLDEFLAARAKGANLWPRGTTATDVEEELLVEFRRWRRTPSTQR